VATIEQWISTILSIFGGLSALAGIGWVAWRYLRSLYRVWLSVDSLHVEFGEEPIKKLISIIRGMEQDSTEIELRQRITETHLGIGVYSCDAKDGRCVWSNEVLSKNFGIDSTEMLGYGWVAAVDACERERVIESWQAAVKDVLPYKEKYRVVPPNGLTPWNAVTEAWPVVVNGKLICMIGYVKRVE